MQAVVPNVYLVGFTDVDLGAVRRYLEDTGQLEFTVDWSEAITSGLTNAECMISMFAKMCYKSLVVGKNANVEKVRSIKDNIANVLKTAHLSILEHVNLSFIITNCSRVYTHEQVRHRTGVAYSQTSGRYVADRNLEVVLDPITNPIREDLEDFLESVEVLTYQYRAKMGLEGVEPLRKALSKLDPTGGDPLSEPTDEELEKYVREKLKLDGLAALSSLPFSYKKKVTSALRRVTAPSGIANELAYTANLRTLRHTIQLRTAKEAEWEIRLIYGKIFELARQKVPSAFADAKVEIVDDLPMVSGMAMQPYE